jgi:hypothetical protein
MYLNAKIPLKCCTSGTMITHKNKVFVVFFIHLAKLVFLLAINRHKSMARGQTAGSEERLLSNFERQMLSIFK